MKKRIFTLIIVYAALLAVPPTLHYQGRLTNTSGVGENASYDMEFSIYDVETGGVALWSQSLTGVEVSRGLFDAELSDIDIPFDGQYWMEIVVDGDVMSPRVKLASSAYAFRAEIADSIAGGDLVIATRDTMIAHWDSIRGIPSDIADGDDGLTEVDWDTDIVNIPAGFDDDIDDVIATKDTMIAHWDSIRGMPTDLSDNIDDIIGTRDTMIAHWDSIRGMPTDLSDNIDDIIGTRDTMIAHWDSLRDIPEGFADGIDNDGGDDGDWTITGLNIHNTLGGNVGIGTSTPERKLTISGSIPELQFEDTDTTNTWHMGPSAGSFYLTETGLGHRLCVNSGGNVGIGIIVPKRKLDVNGSMIVRTDGINLIHGADYTSSEEAMRITGSTSDFVLSLQDGSGRIQHYWNSTTATPNNLYLVDDERAWMWDVSVTSSTYMEYKYAPAGIAGEPITWTTHMAFDTLGNVDVLGDVTASRFVGDGSGLTGIDDGDWTVSGLNIYNTVGKVGIGTTTPSKLLTISGNYPEIQFQDTDTSNAWHIGPSAGSFLITETGLAERLCINSGGNVGIGIIVPKRKLDVNGSMIVRTDGLNLIHGTAYTSDEEAMRITGPQSDYVMSLSDGSGRIQHYWNSTTASPSNRYLVNNERAWMWDLNISNNTYMEFKYAPSGTAGDVISWTTHLSIDTLGNVDVLGDVTANGFVGDGSGLTGIDDGDWTVTSGHMYNNTHSVSIGTDSDVGSGLFVKGYHGDDGVFRVQHALEATTYTTSVLGISSFGGLPHFTRHVGVLGIYGSNGDSGTGVYGLSQNDSNSETYGMVAAAIGSNASITKHGLYALAENSGTNYGVYGTANGGSTNYGVYADATGTTGTNAGIYATASGTAGNYYSAIFKDANAVHINSNLGIGTWSPDYPIEVVGNEEICIFVDNNTSVIDEVGIESDCTAADGSGIALRGLGGYIGVSGLSFISGTSNCYGVRGRAGNPDGVSYGVYGMNIAGMGYGVYSSGDFGSSGSKSAIVRTDEGPKELYCQESPENWFEDFGTASIQDGKGHVSLRDDFIMTVTIDDEYPMKVFITPKARIGEWWVEDGISSFTLYAPDAEDGATFDYRVVAKRRGYESIRLRDAKGGWTDHFLYPNIEDVPGEHRFEWVKIVPVAERETAWKAYLSADEIQLLKWPEN